MKINDIIENYYFVTKINNNGTRQLIGTFEDKDLYYSRKNKFEINVDNNFYKPNTEEMKRINLKYLIL